MNYLQKLVGLVISGLVGLVISRLVISGIS